MPLPFPLKRASLMPGLSLLLISAIPAAAQMSSGGGMDGMDETPAPSKAATPAPVAPKSMTMPAAPGVPESKAMSMSQPPKTPQPRAAMGSMPAEPTKPGVPAPHPAKSGQPMAMEPAAEKPGAAMAGVPSKETGKDMDEPAPSNLDGKLILEIFAGLNAVILAVAAVMKLRRNALGDSREVKA